MDRADHFIPCNFECRAVVDGGGRGQTKSRHCRKSSLPNKITCGEERYGGLLAALGNDGEPRPTLLQVEDGVGWIPRGEEGLLFLQFDDFSAEAGAGQESGKIKYRVCAVALQDTLSLRTGGGSGEDGVGRGHAVEEPENFELGFELVGHAVDDQVRLADGVLDGGDEVE